MRKFLALVVVVVGFQWAQACPQMEAQIAGNITEIKENQNAQDCLVRIKFTSFQSHALCPIDIEDAIKSEIRTDRCDLKVGDYVATYLVSKKWVLFLEN